MTINHHDSGVLLSDRFVLFVLRSFSNQSGKPMWCVQYRYR